MNSNQQDQHSGATSKDNGSPLAYSPDIEYNDKPKENNNIHENNIIIPIPEEVDLPTNTPSEIEQDIPPEVPTHKNPPRELPGKDNLGGVKREV